MLVVSLYTSRVVLNALGVDDYGLMNVVAGFVSLFGFLNQIMASSVQRYYNFEGTQNGEIGFRKVYITSFLIHVILSLVLFILLESIGLWYINNILVVPDGRLFAANVIYQCSIASMILVVMKAPYTGAILATEKFGFYAIVSIIETFLKLGIVIILQFASTDKLVLYGFLLLLISLIDFIINVSYAYFKNPALRLQRLLDKQIFKSMISFAGWNLIGSIAYLFKGQGVNMLLNVYFGTAVNAARGVAYQIYGAISGFSNNITVAYRPQIVNLCANNKIEQTSKLVFQESKICFCLLYMFLVPICLEIDFILKLWLGQTIPTFTNILTILVLFDALVGVLNTPITQLVHATGQIKTFQIASSCIYLLIIPITWFFLHNGCGVTIPFVIAIFMSLLNQGVCLYIVNNIFPFGIKKYLYKVVKPCLAYVVLLPILPYILHVNLDDSILKLMFIILSDIVIAFVTCLFIVLDKEERTSVFALLKLKRYV